ncbi:hypothetical protein [Butyrivibrio sp. AC2005]|uniref:hypothetical protein n=1 Tax=Butyrivibrio sp. AC2005 TaxID=1280672 RepID=UPI0004106A4E|nr:hypothetical protein [Butyrivibrio sp. AC2005]
MKSLILSFCVLIIGYLSYGKIVEKIFGVVLIVMAIGILGGIIVGGYSVPEIEFRDLHPDGLPI